MKNILIFTILLTGCGFNKVETRPDMTKKKLKSSIYDFTMNSINGDPIDFNQYRGKKLLIVNTASECGFTPQYEDLQELNEKYGDKVTILGFPANNFGGQEPGTNEEIASFCKVNYGVTFQIFEKISVVGKDQAPLFEWLSNKEKNGWNNQAPKWNFSKYLINEKGELVKFYGSAVKPMSNEILQQIL
jgi:glutathione peroxidase